MSMSMKILRTFCSLSYKSRSLSSINGYRFIHCSSISRIKMYMEYENQHAYKIMENKGYVTRINLEKIMDVPSIDEFNFTLKEDWTNKTPAEIYKAFPLLGTYSCSVKGMCISNEIFDPFIDILTDNIKFATDEELKCLFYSLLKWPETASIRTRNYIEVWVALDEECLSRIKKWTFDEILSFLALFFMLNVTKASDFSSKALQKLTSKSKHLSPSQLVQTMFYIGIMRRQPFDMHNLELQLEKLFSEFSIDELAIMSMGFFKSKTPIRNTELLKKIIYNIIDNSKEINEISLASLLKIIRYSMKVSNNDIIFNMLEKLQYEVPRLSMMCNVHLALVGMATLTLHRQCLERIAESTLKSIAKTRLKDLERLILTYGTFNYVPNTQVNFFEEIIKELRKPERIPEIQSYGRSFACCVSYLGYLGIYPIDLMNKVLNKDFLLITYGKQVMMYGREVLVIHNTAKLFCPESEINLLSDKHAVILAKKYTDYVPNEKYKKQYNVNEKLMLDTLKILQQIRGGEQYVVADHLVTHHQRGDIIICNDSNGLPVPVEKHFNNSQFGLMRKPPDHNIWIALVIAGRNAVIYNSDVVTGPLTTKIKEINKLGFAANLVFASKYNMLNTNEEKADYLNNLINEAINIKNCKSS